VTDTDLADPWDEVVGQPVAVAQLQAAVRQPVHAFLLVGPRGSGKRAAARAFAGDLLAEGSEGEDAARHRRLAAAEQHPDLLVVERSGASIDVKQARTIVERASRSPSEGSRKVLVLDEFHLLDPRTGGILLKTIEEPPPGTFFVVLAEEVTPDLVTIASRCLQVAFSPVPAAAVEAKLIAEGVPAEAAAEAASFAHGDLGRARLLATDGRLAIRRDAWRQAPQRLDGSGHRAAVIVDELRAVIDDAQATIDAAHEAERAELDAQVERYGLRGAGLTEVAKRHRREVRRFRTDEVRMGLAELARVYRDELAVSSRPEPILAGLQAIQAASEALVRNPNEELLLQALFLELPPLG
jgi:DNA polymerase-3 subunit delta'